jgi:hypothetical protein
MTPLRLILKATAAMTVAIGAFAPCAGLAQSPSDEVIATAQGGMGASPSAAAPAPASTQVATTKPAKDDASNDEPLPDHKIHGDVSVGVGTNGYREVSGDVSGPIGQDGQVMIAIDAASMNARGR